MVACQFKGDSISKVPPFSLVPKRLEASSVVICTRHDFPSPFFMKQQFLPRIGIFSAACRQHQRKRQRVAACPVGRNAIHRQAEGAAGGTQE